MHKLDSTLSRISKISFETFKKTVDSIQHKCAPINRTYVGANQGPFINNKIHKEIMRRTYLTNEFIDSKTDADRKAYNKQRNYCGSLIRKEKRAVSVILKCAT